LNHPLPQVALDKADLLAESNLRLRLQTSTHRSSGFGALSAGVTGFLTKQDSGRRRGHE